MHVAAVHSGGDVGFFPRALALGLGVINNDSFDSVEGDNFAPGLVPFEDLAVGEEATFKDFV